MNTHTHTHTNKSETPEFAATSVD